MSDARIRQWNSMAELWTQIGSPLRPCAEDQSGYWSFIAPLLERFVRPRVVILGVTPELYHLPWPANRDLIAVDRARNMIDEVWPGPKEDAREADWLAMHLPEGSCELVLCDGGLSLMEYPQAQRTLAEQLHRILVPGGRAIFRLFAPPEKRESKETVLDDLVHGRIANLNVLKLRLGMAMQRSVAEGVALCEILRELERVDDLRTLAQRLGWSWDHMRVIEIYRDSPARYHFLGPAELTQVFCHDGRFVPLGCWRGNYPLAERCPIVAFERRHSPA